MSVIAGLTGNLMPMLILQLFWTFFVIGAFTIGGGYAMLSLIQNEVVVHHAWLSESTFTDIVAISQMTPGPVGINTATYVGYDVLYGATGSHLAGIAGSMVTTLALVLPSFVIMLLIVRFYQKFKGNPVYNGVMGALRPTVVGLIAAAAVMLTVRVGGTPDQVGGDVASLPAPTGNLMLTENFPGWKSWILFAAAFVASQWGKINPILIILAAACLGIILY